MKKTSSVTLVTASSAQQRSVPSADRFVHRLLGQGSKLLFLTNCPQRPQTRKICKTASAPPGKRGRGVLLGSHLRHGRTALLSPPPGWQGLCMIGEGAQTHELYKAGFTITDIGPDFVVVGDPATLQLDHDASRAPKFVDQPARFIATNPGHPRPLMITRPAADWCAPIGSG